MLTAGSPVGPASDGEEREGMARQIPRTGAPAQPSVRVGVPAVSVLLCVRDGAAHLPAALASLLSQTLPDFELVAVDDGSTDATPAILAAHAARDGRIRVLTGPPRGLVAALNLGLSEARAPLVARMDADDLSHPERLARQFARMERDPQLALLGCAWRRFRDDGRTVKVVRPPCTPDALRAALAGGNCLAHASVMVRRSAVLACGGYREAFRLAEDYDLWLRLSERFAIAALPEILFEHRLHAGQSTRRGLEQRILTELAVHAATARRRDGGSDGLDGPAAIDRATLAGLGLPAQAVSRGVLARALGAAVEAVADGQPDAARAAIALARREPMGARTRAHLAWLALRARLA